MEVIMKNETTKVMEELLEMYAGHPPLSLSQLPRGLKTLEERVIFELNGALSTDCDEYKLSYLHDAVYSMCQLIALMENKPEELEYLGYGEPDTVIPEIKKTEDGKTVSVETGRPVLKPNEIIENTNELTQQTDLLTREIDQKIMSKNARRSQ
jgi:hypothetical protein